MIRKSFGFAVLGVLVASAFWNVQDEVESLEQPIIKKDKHYSWNEEESKAFQLALAERRNATRADKPPALGFADGTLVGSWKKRGPYNQPGCWEMAAVDSRDNSVWGMTCAHYGGSQFIWKGSLAGDDFRLISGKFPNSYVDMFFRPLGNDQRLLVAINNGGIVYTDDNGTTWVHATGLADDIQSFTVNLQDNNKVYATDGQKVYSSVDGAVFTILKDFGSQKLSRIYTPPHAQHQNANKVYFAHGADYYELNAAGSDFVKKGTGAWPITKHKRFALGGDSRKLYVTNHEDWWVSANQGATWQKQGVKAWSGHHIATNPNGPDTVVLGYLNPQFSQDGMATVWDENIWGGHQVWQPAGTSTQEEKHRVRIHADHQATQFFYDKENKLFTLHSTDGGLMVSYKDWAQNKAYWTSAPDGKYPTDVYRNINLLGCQTSEIYNNGMISGSKNSLDIVTGTQDQGTQKYEGKQNGDQLYMKQSPYGDGPLMITGDGVVGWKVGGSGIHVPFALYEGANFVGAKNVNSGWKKEVGIGSIHSYHFDVENPGTTVWARSASAVAKVAYVSFAFTVTTYQPGNGTVNAFGQSPSSSQTLYLMRSGMLYSSQNGGTSWSAGVTTGLTASSQSCDVWVHPTTASHLVIACPGQTKRAIVSKDGGATFSDINTGFVNADVRELLGSKDGRWVFATTSIGPFVFDVVAEKWFDLTEGTDIPWFNGFRTELVADTIVRFSTWGTGIYDFVIEKGAVVSSSSLSSSESISSSVLSSSAVSSEVNASSSEDATNLASLLGRVSVEGLSFALPEGHTAVVNVLDLNGRHVQHLRLAGANSDQFVAWKRPLATGKYLVVFESDFGEKITRSLVQP